MTCCFSPLTDTLQNLLDFVTIALVDCGRPACSYFVSADQAPAWDNCCDCGGGVGQVWVQLVSVAPVNSPGLSGSLLDCATELNATVYVSVLRCAPTMDNGANPPSAAALTAAFQGQMQDMAIITSAVTCNWASQDPQDNPGTIDASNVYLGQWQPLGPEGGCMGGQLSLTIKTSTSNCGSN